MQAIVDINWALWLSTMAPLALSAGPGNLMVATSGAQSGVRHSLRFIAGLDLTYLLLALLMGLGLYHSLSAYPTLMRGLQIAGSAYIFWRGLRLLRRPPTASAEPSRPLQWRDGVVVQLGNVQGLVMLLVMFASFLPVDDARPTQVLMLSTALIALNFCAHLLWVSLGATVQRLMRTRPGWLVLQNAVFGLLLLAVAGWMLFRAWSI
ncbi:LysE family translocator [Pseudomonas sp. MAFF 302046]|uniref:LysE family translocator n=1 Tax=Pseudomonas morbosilactucae TaxID=2938197 RepID=A0ABT0JGK0_9PSED|nr:LysE family translocator [Pseudomonas morbosilactucae]